ncbi:MAG: hypothetical protein WBV23_03910 [Desulfobaccales bacterium]
MPFAEGYLEIGFCIFDLGNFISDLSTYGPSNWPNLGAHGRVNGKSRAGDLSFKIGAKNGSYLGKNYQMVGVRGVFKTLRVVSLSFRNGTPAVEIVQCLDIIQISKHFHGFESS